MRYVAVGVAAVSLLVISGVGWDLFGSGSGAKNDAGVAAAMANEVAPEEEAALALSVTPEQKCASPQTYAQLTSIIASAARRTASDPSILSDDAIGELVAYARPMLDRYDQTTRRVVCEAMLRVQLPDKVMLIPASLSVSERSNESLTLNIRYAIQPAADDGRDVVSLWQGDDLGFLAERAVEEKAAASKDAAGRGGGAAQQSDATAAADQQEPAATNQEN